MRTIATATLMLVLAGSSVLRAQDAAVTPADVAQMRQMLEQTQAMLREQQEALRQMRRQLDEQAREMDELRAGQPRPASAASGTAADLQTSVAALRAPSPAEAVMRAAAKPAAAQQAAASAETRPGELYFRLGSATFTPSGWVDFTAYYRTTNVGSGLGTNFQSIPYNDTVQGGQSEVRLSAQSSRIGMRVEQSLGSMKAYGYLEADFNGYLPGNGYVSTNPNSLRMRVYYLDLARGKWELLGGQGWSLLTPTRRALSPFLADLFNTFHLDTNYQVGLPYARQTQFRAVYHATPSVAMGLSVENAEQFSGSAVTFPALFSTAETDINSSSGSGGATATPNVHPDVIAKVTLDRRLDDRMFHVGLTGLLTAVRVYTPASVTKAAAATDEREGGAVMLNTSLELLRGFRLIALGYWSDGGGRYLNGTGPGFVVLQTGSKQAPFTAALIHSGAGIGGFEWLPNRRTTISAYASGVYYQRRYALDPGAATPAYVGYGFPGSANTNNRVIEELSLASISTLWQKPNHGALQMVTQSSYLRRAPWYVVVDAPKDAHLFMEYVNLRYVLP